MKRWFIKLLKNRRATLALISLFCFALFSFWHLKQIPPLPKAEVYSRTLRVEKGRTAKVDDRILLLAIDGQAYRGDAATEEELKASPTLRAMQQWPFPRSVYGDLLNRLTKAGARLVMFDLVFPKAGTGDAVFQKALEDNPGKAVLAGDFSTVATQQGKDVHGLTIPADTILPNNNSSIFNDLLGFVNFWPDPSPDDSVRRAIYRVTSSQVNGGDQIPNEPVYKSFTGQAINLLSGEKAIPGKVGEAKLIRFAGHPYETFPVRSISEIFIPKLWAANYQNGEFFRDKIVLIGPWGSVFKDEAPTPYGVMPGPEIHMHALNAALQNDFLRETTGGEDLLTIFAAALLGWVASRIILSPSWRLLSGLFLSGIYIAVLLLLYNAGVFALTIAPLLTLNSINLLGLTYEFVLERIEKARVRSTFERYVSRNVVREILDKREDFENLLGGQRKLVTILFSDIRGFTTMTENADSHDLVERLNEYLSAMVRCVYKTDGTLDKFIGDAVMAVWGNVVSTNVATDGQRAIETALDMLQELRRLNEKWIADGLTRWDIGIGLNHGEVIVGNMGASEKMEFTVIGDPVNLASRLESLTKEYGLELIIGESLATLVKDKFHLQSVDLVKVKGKNKPVEVFAVLGKTAENLTDPMATYHRSFNEGVGLFRDQKFTEALQKFKESEAAKPGDYLSVKVYQPRCIELAANPPGSGWDGVHTMKSK